MRRPRGGPGTAPEQVTGALGFILGDGAFGAGSRWRNLEPFGIAPLEAKASGLALVAPYTGGVRQYADSTKAWLAEANPEAFGSAL
jgi:glycosyltransferase involved in cell wall biosynthesis